MSSNDTWSEPTPSSPPDDVRKERVKPHSGGGGRVEAAEQSEPALIIKDCEPWLSNANELVLENRDVPYQVINSSSLGEADLSTYSIIVLPSTQSPEYYDNLAESRSTIAEYVADGGILVAHVSSIGWPCNDTGVVPGYLPEGVSKKNRSTDNSVSVVDTDHPIVEGVSDDELDAYQTVLADIRGLPSRANVVIENDATGRPALAEFRLGAGCVLVTSHVVEWPWTPLGPRGLGVTTKQLLRNELAYALNGCREGGPATNRSVMATTLTLLPGNNEDSRDRGGDDLNSAMPDYFGKSLDAWFLADKRTSLPDDLRTALELRKTFPEYPGESFRQYRLINQISLSFRTNDSRSISDWGTVLLETSENREPSYVTVEGEEAHGEENAVRTIIDDPNLDWFDGRDKLRANVRRFGEGRLSEPSNRIELRGVDGVRASIIHGGQDTFITKMKEKYIELGPQEFKRQSGIALETIPAFIIAPPTMYTFLELVVMADGAKLARVWDASRYPKHFLYVDGFKRDENVFEEGNLLDGWEENQNVNVRFLQWLAEDQDVRTPFTPHNRKGYEWAFDSLPAYGQHPVMSYGEDGEVLTEEELRDAFGTRFPWE